VRALMVQGASSSAGKSLLVTALARWFARRGVAVAPFKAQNMSNNARVVQGGEIGVAQYLQALAGGVEPDVCMNPVLVKPEGDTRSQVVVLGRVNREISALPWIERGPALWPAVEASLRALERDFELLLIEGAGSPAELNLRTTDLANMRTARAAQARVFLVADIDRGGAFAHLYGTWRLIEKRDRRRLRGFILNKFRGDAGLLAPAPALLQRQTGIRTVGVVPWLEHGLPDEDGASSLPRRGLPLVAVVRYPTASNLDEFRRLQDVTDVVWAREPNELAGAELVVLPGSKHVAADRAWLRSRGFDGALTERVASGERVVGICGGLQLLGGGFDGRPAGEGRDEGLGILPLETAFAPEKRVRSRETTFLSLPPPWQALSGIGIRGYEIRHGRSRPTGPLRKAFPSDLGYVAGPVLATYMHGVFEDPAVLAALFGASGGSLDAVFDHLADAVEAHVEMDAVVAAAGLAGGQGE
jgi:adenosylcobyric acid synthase